MKEFKLGTSFNIIEININILITINKQEQTLSTTRTMVPDISNIKVCVVLHLYLWNHILIIFHLCNANYSWSFILISFVVFFVCFSYIVFLFLFVFNYDRAWPNISIYYAMLYVLFYLWNQYFSVDNLEQTQKKLPIR